MSEPLIAFGRAGRKLDIPVIDAHAHLYDPNDTDVPPLEEQLAEMDRIGIRCAVLSSVVAIDGDIRRGNDMLLAAVRKHPTRLRGYCFVSANYPELMAEELERCFATDAFVGIKVYQTGIRFDDERFEMAWAFAEQRGIPVLAHTWGGDVTGFDVAAQKHPGTRFLTAHTGSGNSAEAYIALARRVPNIVLDLTYSREHTGMIERIVEQVGAARIVWGSDVQCFAASHQIGKILFARISDEDKRRILCDNAAAIFGIKV